MKKTISKILEASRPATLVAGAGYGLSKVMDSARKLSQKDNKTLIKFGIIFIGVVASIATAIGLNICAKKRTESNGKVEESDAEASRYERERRADAEFYTVKKMADENLDRAKAVFCPKSSPCSESIDGESEEICDEDESHNDINNSEGLKPKVIQMSEIPNTGNLSYHQLVGPLLFEGDIMLAYGEPHVAKSSIILKMAMDIVLRSDSTIMTGDEEIHPVNTCYWYNGEMTDAEIQAFFGNFDRTRLDSKLYKIDANSFTSLNEWLNHVEEMVNSSYTSSIVVLDNLACISNSSAKEIAQMILRMKSIQQREGCCDAQTTFIIVDHMNKAGTIAGTYKLKALSSNIVRFEAFGKNHTKITIEKNRLAHQLVNKSFDLEWTTAPEGNLGYLNLGEIDGEDLNNGDFDGDGKVYSDEEILSFHEIYRKTKNQSEASRQTGVPRQRYMARIGKLIAQGKAEPI